LAVIFAGAWLSAQAQPHMVATHHGAIMPPPEAPGLSPDPAKLFANGEEFSYDIYWGIFEVGHADWYVWTAHNANGEATLRSILNVRTTPSVDLFYRVRASSTTWATPTLDRSLQYSTQQDDSYRLRNAQMIFDVKKSLVTEKVTMAVAPGAPPPHRPPPGMLAASGNPTHAISGNTTSGRPRPNRAFPAYGGGPPPPWPLTKPAFDPLAALLYYQTLPLALKFEQHMTVFDTRGSHDVTVRVVGLERVTLATGPIYAWVVEPSLPGAGLLMRGDNKPLQLWIAADGTRRPVRFTGAVDVGSFEADLVSTAPFTPPAPPPKKPADATPVVAAVIAK
jgi:hypothetical protein